MGTILGKGFAQAQVHTEFIARVPNMQQNFQWQQKFRWLQKFQLQQKFQ